jgi:phosphoesterase RecJ-like protein
MSMWELGRLVTKSESILVTTHRDPDGDAIGSLLGFSRMLRVLGKKPLAYCPDGIPGTLSFLSGIDEVRADVPPERSFELTILLDTPSDMLLPVGFPERSRLGAMVVIDHHAAHGQLGDVVIRREASAVGEILLDLQKQLNWPMDQAVAECLYTSIVSDTGSFRYSNATADAHRAAAELIAAGARPGVVATALFESYPLRRQRLLAAVLKTLLVGAGGRLAMVHCTPQILADTGAIESDLVGMIDFALAIDTVEIAALFRLEPTGRVRVSLRSKGDFDVATVATRYGGGGHRKAAGFTLEGVGLVGARAVIWDTIEEMLSQRKEENGGHTEPNRGDD